MDTDATPEFIERENPEALIVAVGAQPIIPRIPGIDLPNVIYAVDTYWKPERVGKKVVMIGGGLVGCETALHLAAQGKELTVVEMLDRLATDASESHRIALLAMMKDRVQASTGLTCTEILPDGIRVRAKDGSEELIEADTVVYAVGLRAQTDRALALCNAAPGQYFLIGDCRSPRKVKQAVHEGYHAAMDIH